MLGDGNGIGVSLEEEPNSNPSLAIAAHCPPKILRSKIDAIDSLSSPMEDDQRDTEPRT